MIDQEFEKSLPIIAEVVKLLEKWPRPKVTAVEIARSLNLRLSQIYKIFDGLGIEPRNWAEPDDFMVENIIETCCSHEIAARFNREVKR